MDTYTIERVDVRSLAFLLAVMALAWAIIIDLVWVVIGFGAGPTPGFAELIIFLLTSPIAGAIVGAIAAILFNLAVVFVGGLEIELASSD